MPYVFRAVGDLRHRPLHAALYLFVFVALLAVNQQMIIHFPGQWGLLASVYLIVALVTGYTGVCWFIERLHPEMIWGDVMRRALVTLPRYIATCFLASIFLGLPALIVVAGVTYSAASHTEGGLTLATIREWQFPSAGLMTMLFLIAAVLTICLLGKLMLGPIYSLHHSVGQSLGRAWQAPWSWGWRYFGNCIILCVILMVPGFLLGFVLFKQPVLLATVMPWIFAVINGLAFGIVLNLAILYYRELEQKDTSTAAATFSA
ncbi:MAG TPA: hypothetical protein VHL08_02575 [Dongiaceae bacterium]|jgi:hypothetical protein|nr:hypothetical protein [Dongiaceae bacterium]